MGYVSKTLQPNTWYLVNNGFTPVSAGEAMPIADIVTGLTCSDEVGYAPLIQYWDGTTLKSAYFLDYTYDDDDVGKEYEFPSWGNDEGVADHHVFNPCEGYWAMVRSGTGIIRFKR